MLEFKAGSFLPKAVERGGERRAEGKGERGKEWGREKISD